MATVHAHDGSGRIVLKGTSEAVLRHCTEATDPALAPAAVLREVEALAARDILASVLVGAAILPVVGVEKWRRRLAAASGPAADLRGGAR